MLSNLDTEDLLGRISTAQSGSEVIQKNLGGAGAEALRGLLAESQSYLSAAARLEIEIAEWVEIARAALQEKITENRKALFAQQKQVNIAKKNLRETYNDWPQPLLHTLFLAVVKQQKDESIQYVPDQSLPPLKTTCIWLATTSQGEAFREKLGGRAAAGTVKLRQQLHRVLESASGLGALQRFQWSAPVPWDLKGF